MHIVLIMALLLISSKLPRTFCFTPTSQRLKRHILNGHRTFGIQAPPTKRKVKSVKSKNPAEAKIFSTAGKSKPAEANVLASSDHDILHIIDGTAMLFQAYFSQEHRYAYKHSFLSDDLSNRLLSKMSPTVARELLELNATQSESVNSDTNTQLDLSAGIDVEPVVVDGFESTPVVESTNVVLLQESDDSATTALRCGAITAMTMQFARFIRDVQPRYVAVSFDAAKKTFRNELYPLYKKQRSAVGGALLNSVRKIFNVQHLTPPFCQVPIDLVPMFGLAPELLESLGCRVFLREGFEADDVMASLGVWAKQHGLKVVHVSADKDMLQLVDTDVQVMIPSTKQLMNVEHVVAKFGVQPAQLCDYQALVGDSADNIPGVKGVGPKAGAALLRHFGNIEKMYSALHLIEVSRVPPEIQVLNATNKIAITHLKSALGSERYACAVSELTEALKDVKCSAVSVLVRLYQCNYHELLVFRQLVTLKTDLTIEDATYARHLQRAAPAVETTSSARIAATAEIAGTLASAFAPVENNYIVSPAAVATAGDADVLLTKLSTNNSTNSAVQSIDDSLSSTSSSAAASCLNPSDFLYKGVDEGKCGGDAEAYVSSISTSLLKPLKLIREQQYFGID